ncbi:Pyochelin synthetase F [Alloalcanivorax dieselolei B5]|uniref:Pyochelin synthetase F n=1 Tax=Alcanivorax dieselolei (strain DSM 16502 / CGMCC 1.3690 / MCCC 1A00001 / B-5) TaxID=930169 RepID=K0CES7_ALCDB|nr:non-ribosomal peptide synthetase [Alloalcanivorax dieselolei]AFT70785.1 Pyochelin synthetase F [Alloalcanivorax dieselolei B5]GGJ97738.1 non-ribosomal peptide synthetase [Alloalcanivorax dieselolei]
MNANALIEELQGLGVELWAEREQLRFRAPKGVLTEERLAALRSFKTQIVDLLRGAAPDTVTADIEGRHEPFPLTEVQEAYLLGRNESFGFGGVACHGYLEAVYPVLDPQLLEDAWNQLIVRHDMLRAEVSADGYQRVLPEVPRYRIAIEDGRDRLPSELERHLQATRSEMDHRLYPIGQWPMFELRLTRTQGADILHFSLDALVADWASAGILFSELNQLIHGHGNALPELEISFRDYVLTQRRMRDGAAYRQARDYWLARLDDLPPAPRLPTLSLPAAEPARFHRHHWRLPAGHWQALRQQAAEQGLTASNVVLAAYVAVLRRWSRGPDFSLNLTLLNRPSLHPQVHALVGDFTSVSLLEVRGAGDQPFHRRAAALGEQLFADLDHRLFSGVEVIREIGRRHGREAALMPVVFTSAIGLGGTGEAEIGCRLENGVTQTPQVFLDCQVRDDADGLEVNWDVRQGVFPAGLVDDMWEAFQTLLLDLAGGERWSATEPVVLPAWQTSTRARVNDTEAPVPDRLLHQAVLEQAALTPNADAVVAPGETLCYGDLVRRAGAVAGALRDRGCRAGDHVAIVMSKGVEQVVGVLGVLLAGAAYLPLEVTQPAKRRDKVLADAAVAAVLVQSPNRPRDLPEGLPVIEVDGLDATEDRPAAAGGDPDSLAYLIYTSGSTGDPKGVMITHRAALNTIEDINRRFEVTGADRVLGLAQLGFDLSVYDIFGPLSRGGALVLPDAQRGADPSHWAECVVRHEVTLWNSVPAQLRMLTHYLDAEPATLSSLRLALVSGDWVPLSLKANLHRHAPDSSLVALGGATEAAIWSNYHRVETVDPEWTSIPYGRPLANQGFRVLDADFRDRPVWVPGELYITGMGLATGYLGDAALTGARFFHHPVDGQRLYRTGDLARYLPSGELEFLGRDDGQVKIRGHRVELGEVEAALSAYPDVAAAAAVVAENDNGDRTLLGFVEAKRGTAPEPASPPVDAARRLAGHQLRDTDTEDAADQVDALHRAALASMLWLMREHGLFADRESRATLDQVLETLAVTPRHRWLVRRWLALLVARGWLAGDDVGGYRRTTALQAGDVERAWRRVGDSAARRDGGAGFVAYHEAHVARLPQLLSGEQNPFELLFPEGAQEPALALYRDDPVARYNNHAVAAFVNRLAVANERTEPLRILEIGAGTGATTEAVVPMLDGCRVEYLFTDLTPFFLSAARQRWRALPWMRFGLFDLDQDYRMQGLAANSLDVVIGAGVLNSTRDPGVAVDRIVELLAPGGWLILTEPTREHPHIMLTQGFMMEPAGDRETGAAPFLSHDGWLHLLASKGGKDHVCLPDSSHPMSAWGMNMIAARFKAERAPLSCESIRAFLAGRLPKYMIPSHLQVLDGLPLTANGKVDRNTLGGWLPAPMMGEDPAVEAPSDDPLEDSLRALWAAALGLPGIGRDDNFYDQGADSLVLARVAGQIRDTVPEAEGLTYDALLRQMLNEPTVAALAAALRSPADETTAKPTDGEAPAEAGTAQARPGSNALIVPFGGGDGPVRVLFHAALGTMDYFQHLGRALAAQQAGPVVGLAVADAEQYVSIPHQELIDRVADDYALRLLDEGYHRFQLIGYCLGGLLAMEVSRRLLERGVEVIDLTLVDSIPMFINTDEELAFEAIFAPNLNLDPVKDVFGEGLNEADVYRAIETLMQRHERHIPAGAMAALDGDEGLRAVAEAVRRRSMIPQDERLAEYARVAAGKAGVPVGPELIPALFRVCRHSMRAACVDPAPYVGDINYLRCQEQQSFGITAGVGHYAAPFWQNACLGEFNLIDVPGNHFSVIEPPHVDTVAAHLAETLRRAL